MNYKILKLDFTTAVHFGSGGLEKTENVLGADTIFSALFIDFTIRKITIAIIKKLIIAEINFP